MNILVNLSGLNSYYMAAGDHRRLDCDLVDPFQFCIPK